MVGLKQMVTAAAVMLSMSVASAHATYSYDQPDCIPTAGKATVDGDISEWNLFEDYYAPMYRAGKDYKPIESFLYLRYDVCEQILYALVLPNYGVKILAQPDDAFIKLGNSTKLVDGNSGDNGTPPDFVWVDRDGYYAKGWEAAVHLEPGTYNNFNVHTQVKHGGEWETSAVEDRAICLILGGTCDCEDHTPPDDGGDPTQAVPEPASASLVLAGITALALRRRRRDN